MIFQCSKCGKEVDVDDNYCRFCGEKQNVEAHIWETKKEHYRELDKIIKKCPSTIYCFKQTISRMNLCLRH